MRRPWVQRNSAASRRDFAGGGVSGRRESDSRTSLVEESTKSLFVDKKSTPRIGLETAARMNVREVSDFATLPQEEMYLPSAPASGSPEEGVAETIVGRREHRFAHSSSLVFHPGAWCLALVRHLAEMAMIVAQGQVAVKGVDTFDK